jgi:hypothetical protein
MSREYDLSTYYRNGETMYGITKLTERPEIAAYGAGYRPHMQYPWWRAIYPPNNGESRERANVKHVG